MASRPEARRPIDAQGMLRIDTPDGRSLSLAAGGETLRLEAPGRPELWALLRSPLGRRECLRVLANMFATHGLTLSLESRGKPILRLGHNVAPSWLARILGFSPAYIPVSAIGVLVRRKSPR